MDDLNAKDVDQAAKIIAGTARSMGYKVIESGKLSIDEEIKKATLIKPIPTEDKSAEKTDGTDESKDQQEDKK